MSTPSLTPEAKEAIRNYMLRLVTLPGSITAIAIFLIGFFLNEVVIGRAYNKAYSEIYPQATAQVIKLTADAMRAAENATSAASVAEQSRDRANLLASTVDKLSVKASQAVEDASRAVFSSKTAHDRAESLSDKVDQQLDEAELLRAQLKTAKVVQQADKLVKEVVSQILDRKDFSKKLQRDFGIRVAVIEDFLHGGREGREQCSWRDIGYDMSHAHDRAVWCPTGYYISQMDIDGCSSAANCPVVGKVKCCKVLFSK